MDRKQEQLMSVSIRCPTCGVPKGSSCKTLISGITMPSVHTLRRNIIRRNEKEQKSHNKAIREAW